MPSIITHHVFAKKVLQQLEPSIQKELEKSLQIYYTFAQSHDYLFYYHFDFKNSKRIKNLGHYAHKNKTQIYFLNIIKYIKENNLENNTEALAYLYGSLTHYCLDSTCHPYIFYKTGTYNTDDKNTIKYRGEHTHIEKDLDAIYYQKEYNKEYKYCNVSKDIIKKPIFSKKLNKLIDATYYETYHEQNISYYYQKSIKYAKFIYSTIVNDRLGIKKTIYKFIDKLTNKKFGYLEGYSTNIKPNLNFLNDEHKTWNHPCDINIKYNYSFDELLEISINKCLDLITEINKVLFDRSDISSLENIIPNVSYSTGLDLEKNKIMKYFEY